MKLPVTTSRRAFLCSTALAALVRSGAAPAADLGKGLIDAHVHVWTPDTKRYPLAEGFEEKEMVPASFTPEELFKNCRPEGVDRVVLIQMSFYKFDNRYMLDVMEQHPGTFSGVAIVDETKPGLKDTMRELGAKGVRGFRLYANKKNCEAWKDSAEMKGMWSHAADSGQAICLLANPDALPAIEHLCREFPKTRVVIDHFARISLKSPMKDADLDHLCRLAAYENVHVKTSAFYAFSITGAPYTDLGPMIKKVRDAYGAQRLMWATDCPYQVAKGHTYKSSVALIRDRLDLLSAEDKEWMLHKTAEKVFFA